MCLNRRGQESFKFNNSFFSDINSFPPVTLLTERRFLNNRGHRDTTKESNMATRAGPLFQASYWK